VARPMRPMYTSLFSYPSRVSPINPVIFSSSSFAQACNLVVYVPVNIIMMFTDCIQGGSCHI
jgi:hypothetical protein